MAFLDEHGVAQLWGAMKDRLSGAFDKVDFDVAEAASNLVSGDSIPTAFGKLAKNYSSILTSISDLSASLGNRISEVNTNLTNQISEVNTDLTSKIDTKLNKSDVLANYTTTATGKALDASLGPAIKTKMDLADSLKSGLTYVDYTATTGDSLYQGYYYADIDIASNHGTVVGIYVQGVASNRPAFPIQIIATRIRVFTAQASTNCTIRVLFKNY